MVYFNALLIGLQYDLEGSQLSNYEITRSETRSIHWPKLMSWLSDVFVSCRIFMLQALVYRVYFDIFQQLIYRFILLW